jgi:hypothetical protein
MAAKGDGIMSAGAVLTAGIGAKELYRDCSLYVE